MVGTGGGSGEKGDMLSGAFMHGGVGAVRDLASSSEAEEEEAPEEPPAEDDAADMASVSTGTGGCGRKTASNTTSSAVSAGAP